MIQYIVKRYKDEQCVNEPCMGQLNKLVISHKSFILWKLKTNSSISAISIAKDLKEFTETDVCVETVCRT